MNYGTFIMSKVKLIELKKKFKVISAVTVTFGNGNGGGIANTSGITSGIVKSEAAIKELNVEGGALTKTYLINGIDGISVIVILALVLSIVLITLSYLLSIRKWDAEKLSPYECGFEPFGDARQKFDIRYYLVSLLFILFDLEVSYLFPLIAVDHWILHQWGYIIGTIFIVILTVGFIYEYSKEALDNI